MKIDLEFACQIDDKIYKEVLRNLCSFRNEKDIARFIRKKLKEYGAKESFPTLVSTGSNASEIHHRPNNTILKGFTIIDFGAKLGKQCTDFTRTVYFGVPSKKEIEIYKKVVNAQKKAIESIKIGGFWSNVDKAARKELGSYAKYFKHTTGHGIGYRIHQKPKIYSKCKEKIKSGEIIAIEVGVYTKKFGIRIEDTLYIGKKKIYVLTKSSKNLVKAKFMGRVSSHKI